MLWQNEGDKAKGNDKAVRGDDPLKCNVEK